MKYQSKPHFIEAVQLSWGTWNDLCDFVGDKFFSDGGRGCMTKDGREVLNTDGAKLGLLIPGIHGEVIATETDWIIEEKDVPGKFYPCKDSLFRQKYEPCSQPSADST